MTQDVKVGDIVQVTPDKEMFGACMVVVTELKSFGIQGYVQSAGVPGQQYIRLKFDEYEPTGGKAVWSVGEQALQIIKLLSAVESWSYADKRQMPDYLYERIDEAMTLLEQEVLK